MDRDKEIGVGLLLAFAGAIWLFLIIIWLPPLTIVAVLVGLKIGLHDTFYRRWLLYVDVAMALGAMGCGIYLTLRRRHALSS